MMKVFILLVALLLVGTSSSAYGVSSDLLDLWERLKGVWVPSNNEIFEANAFLAYELDGREPNLIGGWFESEGYIAYPTGITNIGGDKYIVNFITEDEEEATTYSFQEEKDVSDLDKGIIRILYLSSGEKVEWRYFAPNLDEAIFKYESQW
jgi:hypothetical protein